MGSKVRELVQKERQRSRLKNVAATVTNILCM